MNDLVVTTEETTALALPPRRELTPAIWQMISGMAPVMYKSRLFGVISQDAAAAIMLKGYELGLSITASFEFINVVQGRPGLSPRGALALMHNHPDIESVIVKRLADGTQYVGHECTIRRRTGFEYTARFTMADARLAGLVKNDSGWEHYPENMCLWRAVGFAADVACPDITAGMTAIMKMPEALGVELSQSGEILPYPTSTPAGPSIQEETPAVSLELLLTRFGPEAIMSANDGKIPATQDEVNAVAGKLGASS
jgi:hypothetical protein